MLLFGWADEKKKKKQSSGSSGMIEESSIAPATDVPYLDGDIKGKVT